MGAMRLIGNLALTALAILLAVSCFDEAQAACTLPNTLTNGQAADASQVMANFNALLACVNSGGATPGGSTNGVQYNAGGGSFGGVNPLTNGQLVVGSTGNPPQATTITAGPGITVTNGAGSITIGTAGGGTGSGLYSQVMSATPTSAGTGLTTWLNQGSASVTDAPVGVSISAPLSSGADVTGRYRTAPTPPYTITALISRTADSNSYNAAGIGWYDGSSKLHLISYVTKSGGSPYFEIEKWNSTTSFNGNDYASNSNGFSQPIWLQINDDGTNVHFLFSQDGYNFLQLFSVAKSSGFLGASGYSNVIFFANPQASQTFATLMSWAQN